MCPIKMYKNTHDPKLNEKIASQYARKTGNTKTDILFVILSWPGVNSIHYLFCDLLVSRKDYSELCFVVNDFS